MSGAFRLDVKADLKAAQRGMTRLQRAAVQRAAPRALNDTAKQVRTNVVHDLKDEMGTATGLSISGFKKSIAHIRATRQKLVTILKASGRALPLVRFGARKTKKGVSAKAWGERKVYKGAFIAHMPSRTKARKGHKGVFVRKGGGRLPIKELWGPSIPKIFVEDKILRGMRTHAGKLWPKNFARQVRFYLSKV